jgi:hypothetical protein
LDIAAFTGNTDIIPLLLEKCSCKTIRSTYPFVKLEDEYRKSYKEMILDLQDIFPNLIEATEKQRYLMEQLFEEKMKQLNCQPQ